MLYAFQVSPAQGNVLRFLRGGGTIYTRTPAYPHSIVTSSHMKNKPRRKTIDLLVKDKLIEIKGSAVQKCHLTPLGATINEHNWVDPIDPAEKFGAVVNREKDEIRAELIAAGNSDDPSLMFAVDAEYVKRHKDDPTYRETSKRISAAAKAEPVVPDRLTDSQLAYLNEILRRQNDPMAQEIKDWANAL